MYCIYPSGKYTPEQNPVFSILHSASLYCNLTDVITADWEGGGGGGGGVGL